CLGRSDYRSTGRHKHSGGAHEGCAKTSFDQERGHALPARIAGSFGQRHPAEDPLASMNKWEERWHPLRDEWVIIAAHRQDRPWHGETAASNPQIAGAEYVKGCYLCPGNERIGGVRNDSYQDIFVFDNDHPCVGPRAPRELEAPPGIYRNRTADGM